MAANLIISIRYKGRYSNLFLIEEESKDIPVYDVTFTAQDEQIAETSGDLELFCREQDLSQELSMFAGIVSEEVSVMTKNNADKRDTDKIDMLVKVYPDYLLLDFRSIGKPFDVSSEVSKGSNLDVLRKLSYSADFSYVMGMNLTRIKLLR